MNAKFGVYSVSGNHEYYVGAGDALAWMKRAGIRLVANEAIEPIAGLF